MNSGQKSYATSTAFRRALEDRLIRMASNENVDVQRLRREVAFDRFLTRLFLKDAAPWMLKGGYAMELRIKGARATRDIDLAVRDTLNEKAGGLLEALQNAAAHDLNDFFVFQVGAPTMDIVDAPYGGNRYPVETWMDDRRFIKFHVDIGIGDVVLEPLDITRGRDWLDFAGIPARGFPTISQEQQFAEKLHAYTQPRPRQNSRVRDLVDMILLINLEKMDLKKVQKTIRATFNRRKTHPVPSQLDQPPSDWIQPFAGLARDCSLPEDLGIGFDKLKKYYSALAL